MDVVSTLEMVPIGKIKPYERNARKHDATVDKLVTLIPKVGFNVPLVLDRNNVIVKGHTRWKAARKLGIKILPCVYTDADEETIKLDRIADNRVQEFSQWDDELLASEMASLNLDFDLSVLELNFEMPSFEVPDDDEEKAPAAEPPGTAGSAGSTEGTPVQYSLGVPEDAGITAADLVDTSATEYLEVLCNHCGGHLYIKRP